MSRVEDFYPLSPMQEGMLFHTLCAPDSGVYVTQVSVALPGEVDIAAFERSWRLVAGRHPALRTFFAWEGLEAPVQVVEREVELPVAQHDWRDLSATACGERLAAFLASERACGFDLSQAPLLRLALIRLASGGWQMVWTFHHLILDGWSVSLVLGEVAAAYESLSRGCEPDLVPARPYRDYIVWLRRQDLALAEEHWRRVLRGFTSPTPLPPDPEPAQEPDGRRRAAAQRVRLSAAATAALTAAGRRAGVTLNTLVQGAWAVLLSRYSGQSDVVFGAAVLGRPADLPGADSIVGLFINTLLVRVDAATDAAVGAWLQQLQASWAQARRYEHSPLVQVQGWSEVPRGVPLFESIVVFGGSPRDAGVQHRGESRSAPTRGWALETMDQTNVPLNLEVTPGAELGLEIRYAPARFGEGFVRRMLGHLTTVLAELPADLDRRISDLPLLTAAEREQLLDAWNHTEVALPREGCAHRLFEVRAAQAPDAVALGWGEEELTYGQLNRRANGVAAALLEGGIGGGDVVPLLGRRGPDLAAAILGVWKAGGAYLPLDPRHPTERLLHILEQSAPQLAIVAGELEPIFQQACEGLPPAKRPASLRLERLAGRELEGDPAPRGDPRDLAYVIYTSGSTGLPKGVMIEHRGMLNHLLAKVRTLGLGSADCVAQTAAITFDISVWQLMAALLVGGRVRIVGDEAAADPLRLLGEVERFGVTVLQTVPSMLQAMVERLEAAPRRPALISLVWHLITGEALPPEACRRWLRLYPRIPLLNAYGPTECSDDVTQHVVAAPPAPDVRHLPIGRALDNLRVYVLDPALQPLPVGIPGQLYIGGVGVGRGYQGDPRRTAEAFLPDPFSPRPGARLYRTGDLVRYLTDGTLEFLDRIGQQVKIRGFRIELGEIESALRAHPRVREAAVLARGDVPGDRRLVGYVAPAGGADLDVEELRAFVARSLPDYMVPAAFVILEALPLTSNGKLDSKALPAPAAGRSAPHGPQLVPPRDRVESELVEIWQEVLATRPIGVQDNFFALGGHSLLAVRLMGTIQKRFDQELPLALLVEAGTIEQLAAALRGAAAEPAAWSPLVALQAEGEGLPFFCIHPIGGQVLCYADLSRHLGQRFYGLQAPRLDEVGAAVPAIEEMAAAYLEAVREVQPEGPYLLGGWSMGGILAFEMARQLHTRGEEAALVAILDAWSPAVHRVVPDDAYLLYEIVKDQSLQKGMAPPVSYEELRALQPEECLRRVLEAGRRAGLVAEDVGVSWLRRFLQGYRARREALQRYRPSPHPGRLTLLRAAEEDAGFLRTLQTELGIDVEDPTLGWSALSGKPVAVQIVDGNHSTMCAGDNARVLAGRLRTAIAAAVRDSAAPPELRSAGSRSVLFHDASAT